MFVLFDADGRGVLGHAELARALAHAGERGTPERAAALLEDNGGEDGVVDFGEFCEVGKGAQREGGGRGIYATVVGKSGGGT